MNFEIIDRRGSRKRVGCWECGKVHGAKECPREAVDWRAVERAADRVYERFARYQEAQRA